jgi:hypothetical protein
MADDDLGNVITDSLAAYLLGRCTDVHPNKQECKTLQENYINCNICIDELIENIYPYLTIEEQQSIEKIGSYGPPICANKACKVRSKNGRS